MKLRFRLSPEVTADLKALLGRRTVVQLFDPKRSTVLESLQRIESAGEVAAIFYLAVFATMTETELANRASEVADALVRPLMPAELLALDQHARALYYEDPELLKALREIAPGQVSELAESRPGAHALLGAMSFHKSGYVREAAVRQLARIRTGHEVPFLLIRLNDWIPAVRTAARQAIQDRTTLAYARHFAGNLRLLQQLVVWERVDHAAFLRWILEYLRKPECSAALDEQISSPNPVDRRLAFELLARPDYEDLASLLGKAMRDRDPMIRLWAIRQARKNLRPGPLLSMATQSLSDRYAAVRAQAVYIHVEQGPPDRVSATLRPFLLDPSASLRSIARFNLASHESIDFPEFYRALIESDSPSKTAIAIEGLGEIGTALDADLIRNRLTAKRPRDRAASVRALSRLDGDRFVPEFVGLLLDPSPAVAKEAVLALSKRSALVDHARLWQESATLKPLAARGRVLRLIFDASKWDGLYYALSLIDDPEQSIQQLALDHVRRWTGRFSRSSIAPTMAQRARVVAALAGKTLPFPVEVQRRLSFFVNEN
jgi:HEAT repeat protein